MEDGKARQPNAQDDLNSRTASSGLTIQKPEILDEEGREA
jgi:hypothetical protein